MNKNDLTSLRTKRRILDIARKKFETQGFSNTPLQEIVEELGLTRGAFYHHYKKKEDILFDLVREIQKEIGQYVEERAMEQEELWEQLIVGCVAFVEKATAKDIMKILLVEGPAIISWEEWKRMDTENSESHLKEQLETLQSEGVIKTINIDYLTSFISGGLNELAVGRSHTSQLDINAVESTIRTMLEGIRQHG